MTNTLAKELRDYIEALAAKKVVVNELAELTKQLSIIKERIDTINHGDAMNLYVPEQEVSKLLVIDKDTRINLIMSLSGDTIKEIQSVKIAELIYDRIGRVQANLDQGVGYLLFYILSNIWINTPRHADIDAKIDSATTASGDSMERLLINICQYRISQGMFTINENNILMSILSTFKEAYYGDSALIHRIDISIDLGQFKEEK